MKDMNDRRLVLALAIARVPGLRSEERLLLWDLVDDELSLSSLLLGELEELVGRNLGRRPWAPASYIETSLRDASYLERSGCRFVHYDDPSYPRSLRETARPPFGLFVRGSLPGRSPDAVAVVGTRMPTGKGLDAAFSLARGLAEAGLPVVSGLARGIDAAAHRGALACLGYGASESAPADSSATIASGFPGATYAILPCGIDRVYPTRNRPLAAAILESGGGLISEYPPGTDIRPYRFPERNRIIAGMCRACLVVEAPAKSGALITAEQALDEGRDVWVAADCLGGQRSAGIDRLAAEGAPLLRRARELLEDWGFDSVVDSVVDEDARSGKGRTAETRERAGGLRYGS
jgi:DNA processing protein